MNGAFARRILLVTPKLNGSDGISLVSRVAAASLASAGHSVDVCSLCDEPGNELPPAVVLRTARNSRMRFTGAVLGEALRFPPAFDLVLVMHVHLAPAVLPLVWRGPRLYIFMHGIEVWKRLRSLERAAMRAAASVLANSNHTVAQFKTINSEFRDLLVRVCPLGVEPISGAVAGPPLVTGRYALMVGRMGKESRYKGHELLLDIWGQVLARCSEFKLVIAGGGSDRSRLEQKARSLGLQDGVHFAGEVTDEQLRRLYRDCEFFVMPSRGEGFGLVYLEAMRAGKTCIAGFGAPGDVIEDGVTGMLVDPGRPQHVLDAVLAMSSDAQRTAQMGVAGYRRFMERFTAEIFSRKLLADLDLQPKGAAQCVG